MSSVCEQSIRSQPTPPPRRCTIDPARQALRAALTESPAAAERHHQHDQRSSRQLETIEHHHRASSCGVGWVPGSGGSSPDSLVVGSGACGSCGWCGWWSAPVRRLIWVGVRGAAASLVFSAAGCVDVASWVKSSSGLAAWSRSGAGGIAVRLPQESGHLDA